jgi:hypothetical protein
MSSILPSYGDLRQADAVGRLFWQIQGPLETNLFVLSERKNPDSAREPYFQQSLNGTTWHPISQESLTRLNVSSIRVEVDQLKSWEENWLESHRHAFPGQPGCVYRKIYDDEEDENEGYEEEEGLKLIRCCDTERPKETLPLEVRASTQPYVTVHDYVTTVHPWLLGLRQDILQAMNVWEDKPLPEDTKLMVNFNALHDLTIMEEQRWIEFARPVQLDFTHSQGYAHENMGKGPEWDYMKQMIREARGIHDDEVDIPL